MILKFFPYKKFIMQFKISSIIRYMNTQYFSDSRDYANRVAMNINPYATHDAS